MESSESELCARRAAKVMARPVFVDAEAMKAKVRMNLMKPQYDVSSYYHDTGLWRTLATNVRFEKLTLAVIAVNSIYIGIEADWNKQDVLLLSHPAFQVAEHLFCVFFAFEWVVRFMAFREKKSGFKDSWFIFDSVLVFMMVMETWVLTVVMTAMGSIRSSLFGNTSILRVARLARLTRMARMARLLRVMPELMILIKGIVAATRSVFFTLCLLVLLLYVFAIAFTQLALDTTVVGPMHFDSVSMSMYTLLVYATFLDDLGSLLREVLKDSYLLFVMLLVFILLSALTVMNMLIGVLCEVVSAVAATERESLQVAFVTNKMQEVLSVIDKNGDGMISEDEFRKILESPDAVASLHEVGVDVVGLIDFADHIFEEESEEDEHGNPIKRQLTLHEFMSIVLQLRGTNIATVKDVVDLRKFVRTSMKRSHHQLLELKECIQQSRRASIRSRNGAYFMKSNRNAVCFSRSASTEMLDCSSSDPQRQNQILETFSED